MNERKTHTRNQKRMYRIHKLEEKIHNQDLIIASLMQQNAVSLEKIKNAIDRLEALIIFWKKYNPIDNTMQVEQFKGVIDLLKQGGINENN